jgi:hypothetical protein
MKLGTMIAFAGMFVSAAAFAGQGAVQFEVVLLRDGKVVSSPKVVAEFGKKVALAQGGVMRFEGSATAPDRDGNSLTSVKLYLFENGRMRPMKRMSMLADLTRWPSMAVSVPGTNARFVVRPALVSLPEPKG